MDQLLNNVPSSWGRKLELQQHAVAFTTTGPNSVQYRANAHYVVVHFCSQNNRELALNSDRRICGLAPIGSLEIIPAQSEVFARWRAPKENILVAITEHRLRHLAGIEHNRDDFELHTPKLGFVDPIALDITRKISAELNAAELGSEESIESWMTLLSIHLLRNHSSLKRNITAPRCAGLSARTWKLVNDYILAHLGSKLTLETLAKVAQLSPSHFARAFRETTGQSPHQYIVSARLNCARQLIVGTRQPFHDIAKFSGFSNNSHMTALIRRNWNVTPTRMRSN